VSPCRAFLAGLAAAGVAEVVEKPFDGAKLLAAIARAIPLAHLRRRIRIARSLFRGCGKIFACASCTPRFQAGIRGRIRGIFGKCASSHRQTYELLRRNDVEEWYSLDTAERPIRSLRFSFFLAEFPAFCRGGQRKQPKRSSTMSDGRISRFFAHASRATPNRWAIAGASCLMQAALGSVYASSVFVTAIMDQHGASRREAGFAFTLTILALSITAGFGGTLQRRFGPRLIASLGGLLYGLGTMLAALAPNLPLFYLAYGVIGGIGLGLGYIVPLAMLIRWFPDRRGLITGIAVAGFGGGALITGPIAAALLAVVGLDRTLATLGAAYLVVCVGAAQVFRTAPEGYRAPGAAAATASVHGAGRRDWRLAEALRAPRWYLLWLILALNIAAGSALVSVASPLAQALAGVTPARAAVAVMVFAVCNGFGRVFWGWASDRIGRPQTFAALFAIQVVAFALLTRLADFSALLVPVGLVGLCLGGGFATMPAFAADFFGARHAGAIYGAMLTAWGAGAVAGPLLMASLDYRSAAEIIALVMGASVPLALAAHPESAALARKLASSLLPRPAAAGADD
jgi:MFS transporter, OFA family, oxalate/formate antiporter